MMSMNQVAIVFWSGTGNTEMMANCIADGVREAGGEAVLIAPGEFSAGRLDDSRGGFWLSVHGGGAARGWGV